MDKQYYTTQLQAGLALIEETKNLFELWQPGMNTQDLVDKSLDSGFFPNVTARRLRNIVAECFYPRYLKSNGVGENVKSLLSIVNTYERDKILFLYTARANLVLADFVTEVYWTKYVAGYTSLTTSDSVRFVENGLQHGKMKKPWSKTTIKRVSSYILGCLVEYGFLTIENRTERKLVLTV